MAYTIGFKLKSLTFEELCIKCAGQFSETPLAVWECRKPVQKKWILYTEKQNLMFSDHKTAIAIMNIWCK